MLLIQIISIMKHYLMADFHRNVMSQRNNMKKEMGTIFGIKITMLYCIEF